MRIRTTTPGQDVTAVAIWQSQVQQDQIGSLLPGHQQPVHDAAGTLDPVAGVLKVLLKHGGDIGVVRNQQNEW